MAFTSLQTLLPLAAVISVAQSIFNPGFAGLPLQPPFGAAPGSPFSQGFNNYPGLDPFQQGQDPRKPRELVYTVRAYNDAGDHLFLNLRPPRNSGNPFQSILGPLNPLFARPLSLGGQMEKTEVTGTFVKGGSSAGVPVQGSLNGMYTVMLFENGNTDGYCEGVGRPYVAERFRRSSPQLSPLGPIQGLLSSNPFFRRSPFQPEVVKLSVPINTRHTTSSIHGFMNVNMKETAGRAVVMCRNPNCNPPANLCGTVTIDQMSIENFVQFKRQKQLLREVAAQTALRGDGGFNGVPTAVVGGEPEEIFSGPSSIDTGDLGVVSGGGFAF